MLRLTINNENSGGLFTVFNNLAAYFQSRRFLRFIGNNIVDSPPRNPKGCKKVAGGRSPRRPPGMGSLIGSHPGGCQNFRCSDLLGCDLYGDLRNSAGVEFDENN